MSDVVGDCIGDDIGDAAVVGGVVMIKSEIIDAEVGLELLRQCLPQAYGCCMEIGQLMGLEIGCVAGGIGELVEGGVGLGGSQRNCYHRFRLWSFSLNYFTPELQRIYNPGGTLFP